MKLLTQNDKMKRSSLTGIKIFNFGIPAFRSDTGLMTCPMAGACAAGCYAKSGAYLWGAVKNAYEQRLEFTQQSSLEFVAGLSEEIDRILKNKSTLQLIIRIHDSGDFYSLEYYRKWQLIMEKYPEVKFYAYTKMVKMFKGLKYLPDNFTLIYSLGGKQDKLIDQSTDRHSKVFDSLQALTAAGYVDTSHDDKLATGENPKIGLVYHGAKSFGNTLWGKVS